MWVVATVLLEHIQTEKVIVPRKYVSTEKRKNTTTEQVLMNVLDIEKKPAEQSAGFFLTATIIDCE